jgi:2-methylcitrate dehydratase
MDAITRKIADYAAGARFTDLTDEAIHAATQRLLDSLGCALGACNCEPAQIGRRLAAGQTAGKYSGRVLCFADQLPAEAATFINTAMIRNLDFNDRYPGGTSERLSGRTLGFGRRHAHRRQTVFWPP